MPRRPHDFRSYDIQSQHEFTDIVLNWSWDTIGRPLIEAESQEPLPSEVQDLDVYYDNFKPFILEEARATINDGLEKTYRAQLEQKKNRSRLPLANAFDIQLTSVRFPRNQDNPVLLTFSGLIPKKIEHGFTLNVLMLQPKNSKFSSNWLGIASESPEKKQINVKIIDSVGMLSHTSPCVQKQHLWTAHYLGSILSEERMYQACVSAVKLPCLNKIIRAKISAPSLRSKAAIADLNLSQSRAVTAFLDAPKNSTTLLQGPPGTGKTTTVARLLEILDQQNKRTLICAHSNKGVQVLAEKAMKLLPDAPMILVGVEAKIPDHLKNLSLNLFYCSIEDALMAAYTNAESLRAMTERSRLSKKNLVSKMKLINDSLLFVEKQWETFNFFDENKESYGYSKDEFNELYKYLDEKNISTFSAEILDWFECWDKEEKSEVELHVLNNATMIFVTLISSGRKSLAEMEPIDVMLVDEAAQSVEAATLIPMRFKPKKILLVGDPQQLPGTVISSLLNPHGHEADHESKHYDWSMMWRLINEAGAPHLMLNRQYRMHPLICQWPSSQYYGGELKTGPDILPMEQLSHKGLARRPYAFYTVSGRAEKKGDKSSVFNKKEADYIVKIIRHLRQLGINHSIGVITPYVAQRELVLTKLSQAKLKENVEVNTVDAYQGDERDIMIVSFVRSHVTTFLKEYRRLNVAVTRAKFCLIMLGNATTLTAHDIGQLVKDARLRNKLFSEADLERELKGHLMDVCEMSQHYIAAKKLLDGDGRKQNLNAARQQFLGLAKKGDVEAQFQFAMMCQHGQGGQRQLQQAIKWHRASAQQDNPSSLYQLYTLLDERAPSEARWFLIRAAELLHKEAQHTLGQLYLVSNRLIPDTDLLEGPKWLRLAAMPVATQTALLLGETYKRLADNHAPYRRDAFFWFKHAADHQLKEACYLVAECYQSGFGVESSDNKAMTYFRFAAKKGHLDSAYCLGLLLLQQGTVAQEKEAIKWFRVLGEQAISKVYYPLACLLTKHDKLSEAVTWHKKSANNGNRQSEHRLAQCYRYGLGIDADPQKAIKRYRNAASRSEVLLELAEWLLSEDDLINDLSLKMHYIKLAADLTKPHIQASYSYGIFCYDNSQYKQAAFYLRKGYALLKTGEDFYQYAVSLEQSKPSGGNAYFGEYLKAAKVGHLLSAMKVANMLKNGVILYENEETESTAFYWFKFAADNYLLEGCAATATCYETAYGTPEDVSKAVIYLRKGAELGDENMQCRLAAWLSNGYDGVAPDITQAIACYLKAAKQNYSQAYYPLACLLTDAGRHRDALLWYHKADQERHVDAKIALARCYRYGNGTAVDFETSFSYYRQLADTDHASIQVELADWLIQEDIVNSDKERFMPYLRLAANQSPSHQLASYRVGLYLYSQGQYRTAAAYFQRSNEQLFTADTLYCFASALEQAEHYKPVEYFDLYVKAAKLDHPFSMVKVAHMLEAGEVKHSNNLVGARLYYNRAAKLGVNMAKYHFARFLENGIGGPKNEVKARKEYQHLCEHYPLANYRLACMLSENRGGPNDALRAYEHLKIYVKQAALMVKSGSELDRLRAEVVLPPDARPVDGLFSTCGVFMDNNKMEPEYLDAHYRLGKIYEVGYAAIRNVTKAKQHYKVASNSGHVESHYALGLLYERGQLGQAAIAQSTPYYERAAAGGHPLAKMRISVAYTAKKKLSGFFSTPTIPTDEELNERKDNCLVM